MVADCLATTMGWMVGACDVAMIAAWLVAWAMPAAQVNGSSTTPLGCAGRPGR